LMSSIQKGAIAYLPKEKLPELEDLLGRILSDHEKGEPPWKLLFELLGDYFDQRFGPDWKEKNKGFLSEFSRDYYVSRGIRERLMHDTKVRDKGF
ncbi:MAG: response regulator, partial [Proteobacteria bacterium]|nr:response regulator [Pseudomonadota bacterium]